MLDTYTDTDWAGNIVDRKSQTSIHLEADGCALFGVSRRQSLVAQSTGEAEVYGAASGMSEGVHFKDLLEFMGFHVVLRLHTDSSAAKGIMTREGTGKIRHLSVRILWIQQVVKKKEAELIKVLGLENPADLGTKSHPAARLIYLKQLCHLVEMDFRSLPEADAFPVNTVREIQVAVAQWAQSG